MLLILEYKINDIDWYDGVLNNSVKIEVLVMDLGEFFFFILG